MSETPVQQPPITYPTPPPSGSTGPGWFVTLLVGVVAFLLAGRLPLPGGGTQPEQPPVVEPGEPQPPPAEPDQPLIPDTPPVVEPEPIPFPKPMDETAAIARYAAELLPDQCKQDFAKMAESAAGCADRIDAGFIRDQDEASAWLTVENRKAATDYAAWVPFFRAMQSRFKDLRSDKKMETLADWSREFRSMGDGLAAAAINVPISKDSNP